MSWCLQDDALLQAGMAISCTIGEWKMRRCLQERHRWLRASHLLTYSLYQSMRCIKSYCSLDKLKAAFNRSVFLAMLLQAGQVHPTPRRHKQTCSYTTASRGSCQPII